MWVRVYYMCLSVRACVRARVCVGMCVGMCGRMSVYRYVRDTRCT